MGLDHLMEQLAKAHFVSWLEQNPNCILTPLPLSEGKRGWLATVEPLTRDEAERLVNLVQSLAEPELTDPEPHQ